VGIIPIPRSSGARCNNTNAPKLDHCATLEALPDKEVVFTLNNWNFQCDKANIKMLETHKPLPGVAR
jgi:hypothetical protein